MMTRISVTSLDDYDNSDPAAASPGGPEDGDPAASTPDNSINRGSNERSGSDSNSQRTNSNRSATNTGPSEEERMQASIQELRAILPDASIEELRQMVRENDRASENTRQTSDDAEFVRRTSAVPRASALPPPPSSTPTTPGSRRPRLSTSSGGGSRRSWVPCQPAPSRPGVIRVGGPIERGATYNIGTMDEMELEIKRIEAVSQVQDALNNRLGYNLRESGKYEEMERAFKEGEQMLASSRLQKKKLLPTMKMWDAPPVSRKSMMKKEPSLPEPGEPLPLPLSFGGHDEGMQNGGNRELQLGKFVDPGPEQDEEEHKQEETLDSESWSEVSIDESPMGPYDQVVRCWKCRAGLKVHIEVGLVACPRCRSISPATEMANIG